MTNKIFVLVDQSIKGVGGHHFEYAVRVLNVAKSQGFRTCLLTHRDFNDEGMTAHHVIRVFRRTFWENFVSETMVDDAVRQLGGGLGRLRRRMHARVQKATLRLTYTEVGYTMLWAWDAMRQGPHARVADIGGLAAGSNRTFAVVARFFWRLYFMLKDTQPMRFLLRWTRKGLAGLMLLLVGIVSAPFVLLIQALPSGFSALRSPATVFESDLAKALKGTSPDEIGYVFVPTLHLVELEGIARFLAANPAYQQIPWGLLYRRNIFDGLPHEYDSQLETIRPLKAAFDRCSRAVPNARLELLTDTNELTDQYDRVGVYKFHTIPVPSDLTLDRRKVLISERGGPLTLAYLGDARDEKGYPCLPELHRWLYHDYVATGRVRFLLQSNFNIEGGEPGSRIAHYFLRDCNKEGVELIYGPFERDAYQKLIAQTDVMLLPYNMRNYSARSSGVFAEAVAAGIPSVVPGGSWMASVLAPHQQAYLRQLFGGENARTAMTGSQPTPLQLVGSVRLSTEQAMKGMRVHLPCDSGYAVIRAELSAGAGGFIGCTFVNLNRYEVPVLTEQQMAKHLQGPVLIPFAVCGPKVWVKVSFFTGSLMAADASVWLDVYGSPDKVPLGVGASIYGGGKEGFFRATKEVIEHYDHYRQSAERLTTVMASLYDPSILLSSLMLPTTRKRGTVITGALAPTHQPLTTAPASEPSGVA